MGEGGLSKAAARRAAIMEKIRELRTKIAHARRVKSDLKNADNGIGNAVTRWTGRYAAFQSNIMSEIVVADKFEGESAEKIRMRLPDAINRMTVTISATESVRSEVSVQITKLDEYIGKLQDEIAALQSELWAV